MNRARISQTLITIAAGACRFAGLAGRGARTRVPRRRRGRGGMACVFAVVVALLAAVGVPGVSQSATLARSLSAPNWTQQSPATSPPGRFLASMAYDAATGTVVLFGGVSGILRRDTWTWNGSTWTKQHPAVRPSGGDGSPMAYDAATGTVVMFGSANHRATAQAHDTWTWNGSTWTKLHPAAAHPPRRGGASMAYDAATGTIVMFGGLGNSQTDYLADTWTWDGSTWTKQHPAVHPPGRTLASMAYDAATGTIVLFGGLGSHGLLSDTWTWDGSTWTKQAPAAHPAGRSGASMAYDAAASNVVLFGGNNRHHGFDGDTWAWDGSAWTKQSPAASPPARSDASMAYDAATGNIVMFGGGLNGSFTDTWTWGSN
jgi:hypothetical protein